MKHAGSMESSPAREERPQTVGHQKLAEMHGSLIANHGIADLNEHPGAVELGTYLSWVKVELEHEAACLELPFTIILLISFSMLALLHLKQESTFVAEGAWKSDIANNANFAWSNNVGHKTIHDVNSIPDFWSWFRIGFLPLVVSPSESWSFSERLDDAYKYTDHTFGTGQLPSHYEVKYGLEPDESWAQATLPVRGEVLHFNHLVAGIRLRQERSEASWSLCKVPFDNEALVKAWIGKPCMPASPAYELSPEVGDAEVFKKPERVEWMLPVRDFLEDLQLKAVDMEDGCSQVAAKRSLRKVVGNSSRECLCKGCVDSSEEGGLLRPGPWLDQQTQRVEVGMVAYNQNYGLISLVTINFFFPRGGHIYKLVHVQSAWSSDFNGDFFEVTTKVAFDVIWLAALSYVAISEAREIISVVQSSKIHWYVSLANDYLHFWNCVDWVSIVCAYAVLGTWIRQFLATIEANNALLELASTNQTAIAREESEQLSAHIFQVVEGTVAAEGDFRFTLSFYPMVVMLRLFKSFDAQPRLSVVTKTLMTASQDIIHFFIIFFSVTVCMVLNATLIFGQDMEEFATIDRSFITCFRAMLGEWDWNKMKSSGRVTGGLWISIFIVMIVVLLLNMLLAILMDSYAVVKSKASGMISLPEQISELLRRRRQFINKDRVRLNDIWDAYFDKIGDEKEMLSSKLLITPEDVMQEVAGIPANQAKRTLDNAQRKLEKTFEIPYTSDDVKEQIELCKQRSAMVQEEVHEMRMCLEEAFVAVNQAKEPQMDAKESTMRIVDMVKGKIEALSRQVKNVLLEESSIYEERQHELVEQQRQMMLVGEDARTKLVGMINYMQVLSSVLKQQAAKEQVRVAQANPLGTLMTLAGLNRGVTAACSEVEVASSAKDGKASS
eukprot:TRINITY_DN56629_c0_g1_i1.p1 TRINITY_DN56629_c0_g1~~TRINITY_DN56629_c0_g1_i1.p1  ORF type:complete len:895 (+),score=178.65 TRINITY_DN56629_c0_g1_i1:33-2717(+)